MLDATAYWVMGPGRGALRRETLDPPGPGAALVETHYTGISPGTERLVHQGRVPADVADLMRAPFQDGDFDFPVKYGYLAVGVVSAGPPHLRGRRVFCLHPHQDRFVVPAEALIPIPDGVPSPRAVLAGAVQTAVNAVWDCPPQAGDRVAVIGAGLIGSCAAAVLSTFPLAHLEVIDPDAAAAAGPEAFGVPVGPGAGGCDIVFHTSATEEGLTLGLSLLRPGRTLVELSWYGTRTPRVPLGGDFHARRLTLLASQVSTLAARDRPGRTRTEQWETVFRLLQDERYDALLSDPIPFDTLPRDAQIPRPGRCPVVVYPAAHAPETDD